MQILDRLRKSIEEEIEMTKRELERARVAQLAAPSAMESHSDTTRSEKEKLVTALERDVARLEELAAKIPTSLPSSAGKVDVWRSVKMRSGNQEIEVFMVPDGMGGRRLGNVVLLSDQAPLGQVMMGKAAGDRLEFNKHDYIVGEIE